ncbi:MAG: DUF4296 domain-containing protein [Ginsengibacter sp.]
MKRFYLFVLLCMFFSCSNKNETPSGIIPPKQMSGIIWDLVKAQALASEVARKDSSMNVEARRKILTREVFEIHKTDSNDFDKSYDWYTNRPELLRIMIDSLYIQKQRENEQLIREGFKPIKHDSLFKKIMKNE